MFTLHKDTTTGSRWDIFRSGKKPALDTPNNLLTRRDFAIKVIEAIYKPDKVRVIRRLGEFDSRLISFKMPKNEDENALMMQILEILKVNKDGTGILDYRVVHNKRGEATHMDVLISNCFMSEVWKSIWDRTLK